MIPHFHIWRATPAIVVAAVLAAPGLATAQAKTTDEVVATAQPGSGAPSTGRTVVGVTTEDVTDQPDTGDRAPLRDRKVHGAVSVAVGTSGYREVSGVVTGPVGDNGQATIAIDAGTFNGRRR